MPVTRDGSGHHQQHRGDDAQRPRSPGPPVLEQLGSRTERDQRGEDVVRLRTPRPDHVHDVDQSSDGADDQGSL